MSGLNIVELVPKGVQNLYLSICNQETGTVVRLRYLGRWPH
jgi:hypothetical protein